MVLNPGFSDINQQLLCLHLSLSRHINQVDEHPGQSRSNFSFQYNDILRVCKALSSPKIKMTSLTLNLASAYFLREDGQPCCITGRFARIHLHSTVLLPENSPAVPGRLCDTPCPQSDMKAAIFLSLSVCSTGHLLATTNGFLK